VIYPRETWQEHLDGLPWRQGEHVLIAAPTGSGKSALAAQLVEKRGHVVNFITKTKDPLFSGEAYKDWVKVDNWNPKRNLAPWDNRVLLWPKALPTMAETSENQKLVFKEALEDIFKRGGWCAVFDELHYLSDIHFLNLAPQIAILHHMGRSNNVSLVNLTQRPSWIPKIIYSSVSHAYIARTKDSADLKRLSDLGGVDGKKIAQAVAELPTRHDFLYVNPMGDKNPVVVNIEK
jgi:energy-coupling factor transporter ATP-binding protein EcfA2